MQTIETAIAEAKEHSTGNRSEIESSRYAGCTSCCAVYASKEVTSWRDEWSRPEHRNRIKRWTAECPRCGCASVIGSASGLLDDEGYLPIIHGLARGT